MNWENLQKEARDAQNKLENLKKQMKKERPIRNQQIIKKSIIDGKLKRCELTIDEFAEKVNGLSGLNLNMYDIFLEASDGAFEVFETFTELAILEDLRGWGKYKNKTGLGNHWEIFCLIYLKNGYYYIPVRWRNWTKHQSNVVETIYHKEGAKIETDIIPNLKRIKTEYEKENSNESERKVLILQQAIDSLRIKEIFDGK